MNKVFEKKSKMGYIIYLQKDDDDKWQRVLPPCCELERYLQEDVLLKQPKGEALTVTQLRDKLEVAGFTRNDIKGVNSKGGKITTRDIRALMTHLDAAHKDVPIISNNDGFKCIQTHAEQVKHADSLDNRAANIAAGAADKREFAKIDDPTEYFSTRVSANGVYIKQPKYDANNTHVLKGLEKKIEDFRELISTDVEEERITREFKKAMETYQTDKKLAKAEEEAEAIRRARAEADAYHLMHTQHYNKEQV